MLAPRYRLFAWLGPLLFLNWLSLAVFDPNAGGPYFIVQGYFLGSLFAHPTLAAAWAAFGPGPIAWRFPLSLAWAVSLPSAVGINVALNGGPRDAVVVVGVSLLAQWLILQFPLWALALGFGLHLRHIDDLDGDANGGQIRFGIRHLPLLNLIDASGPKMSDLAAINIGTAALVLVTALVVRLNGYCLYARARGIDS